MNRVINTMSTLVSNFDPKTLGTPDPQSELLQIAIEDFRKFSGDFETYFKGLIANKQFDPEKTTADRLGYQYAQTLQSYWSSLEQVILQWQVGYYRATLAEAQNRATQYLEKLNLSLPGVLIYFNKVASIRYLPFTRMPILGIPHPFSGDERWSAISHELGHYVFWNLGPNLLETQSLQKKLKNDVVNCLEEAGINEQQHKFVIPWVEEVFCDIVGTWVDGREFVDSSEYFLSTQAGNKNDLTLNDGHHPPLVVRPFIWYRALKSPGENGSRPDLNKIFTIPEIANLQDLKVQAVSPIISGENEAVAARTKFDESDYETASVGDLLAPVEKMVDFLRGELDGILSTVHFELRKSSAFQELKHSVEEKKEAESKFNDQEVYEILLKPQALEEGYTHTHGIQLLHGWHESTTHPH